MDVVGFSAHPVIVNCDFLIRFCVSKSPNCIVYLVVSISLFIVHNPTHMYVPTYVLVCA